MTSDWLEDHEALGDGNEPDGVTIARTPDGSAVVLPKQASRLRGEALEAFADVQHVGLEFQRLDALRDEAVAVARAEGVSWHLIGWCFGTSGEAARQRYGHLS